ncbi:MAG: hypothetical protein M3R06_05610 [Chloroflexota bacterium]|nr:hypothetical protein [Chloroflexota bacterium]
MRERFAFNAAFDAQIQQTVVSSTDLLRTAAELRSHATNETAGILARVEESLLSQDIRHKHLLAAILTEIAETQFQAERLSSVVDSLSGQARTLAHRLTYLQMLVATNMGDRTGPTATDSPDQEASSPQGPGHTAPEGRSPMSYPFRTGMGTDRLMPDANMPLMNPVGASSRFSPGTRQPMTVIFQQVPSASVAHDLQRFVDGLPQVLSVSTREFTAGILRLQLLIDRNLGVEDFRYWDGAPLLPLHALNDVIVLRLGGGGPPDASAHETPRDNAPAA